MKRTICFLLSITVVSGALGARAESERVDKLAEAVRKLKSDVLPEAKRKKFHTMIRDDHRRRVQAANDRSSGLWRTIRSRAHWELYHSGRLRLLRRSLGRLPEPPDKLNTRVAGTLTGDGYRIENLVFESRPGLWVTANLYLPVEPAPSMPGILICHSHHTPKEHGELQDMGMTWARSGCLVLVMDQLGHGERRQHPFRTAADFSKPYRVGRQDYYFRYDTGIQLHLVGESLIGWMVWDLMRGVDLLLAREGIDPERIILLGAVAGGGDPAAVAGALDRRIAAVVPFNFGGPQPETRYPLPDDAETSFNYAGSGSWESTRNLRRSAADGFLPWEIVGSIAPRRLIYAHEFSWDQKRDPVWKRLEKIYGLYNAGEHLAFTHGRGELKGRPPEASHCTHIGRVHREMIHPAFKRWFDIPVTEEDEYQNRRDASELRCITPEVQRELRPRRLCDLLTDLAAQRAAAARKELAVLPPDVRPRKLCDDWARLLGDVEPRDAPPLRALPPKFEEEIDGIWVQRMVIQAEPGIAVPTLLFMPSMAEKRASRLRWSVKDMPLVVAVAQGGKERFLRDRSGEIAALLAGGVAVCLPDLRGTGETRESTSRDRYSADVGLSSTELMLGGTTVGARLRDLRAVLRYLQGRARLTILAMPTDVPGRDALLRHVDRRQGGKPWRIALWGDSFAEVNPADTDFRVPRHMDGRPKQSEPLGGLLALLGALYDEDICAVYVRGGLSDFSSVLRSQFVEVPHDVVIPGALTAGDLPDLAAVLAPRPLRLDGPVDGLNRRLGEETVRKLYQPAVESYREAGAAGRLFINDSATDPAAWLLERLRAD